MQLKRNYPYLALGLLAAGAAAALNGCATPARGGVAPRYPVPAPEVAPVAAAIAEPGQPADPPATRHAGPKRTVAKRQTAAATQSTPRVEPIVWRTNLPKAFKEAKLRHKALMIDFYTDWCGWCKRLDAIVYPDPDIATYSKHFVMARVNPEKDASARNLAVQLEIRGFPFIAFIKPDGTVLHVIDGFKPAPDFLRDMEDAFQVASK